MIALAKKKKPRDPSPDRFDEAVDAFRRKVPVTDDEYEKLTAREKVTAFRVAAVQDGRVVQEVFDALDKAIEDGTTFEDFKVEVQGTLAEAWGGEDAPRLEMTFRTNVLRAYNDGRTAIFSDPEVRKARPYLRFDSVGDSRTCAICEPLDGTILPADDPFWRTHQGPLHPGCRCLHTALSAEEAGEEGGVDDEPPEAEPPAPGFGLSEDYDPDLSGFHPDVARVLRERMKVDTD